MIKYFTAVEKNFLKPAFRLLKRGGSVHEWWLYICSPKGFSHRLFLADGPVSVIY